MRLDTHPFYNRSNDERSSFDAAIVRLDGPLTDAGPPPALYAGRDELGKQIVMVGYGMRGIGSVRRERHLQQLVRPGSGRDQRDRRVAGRHRAAAAEQRWWQLAAGDAPARERGAGRLDGLLGSGDSGGSAWMPSEQFGWVIVGINANGTGKATYGEHSEVLMSPGLRDWILRLAPGARFVG